MPVWVDSLLHCLPLRQPRVAGAERLGGPRLVAWDKGSGGACKIEFLADGKGEFTMAGGLSGDMAGGGMGVRSQRYSMIVDDGVVKALNVEDSPGKADVAGAAALLGQL